jgi:predicted DNA-binding transcriptional regulator YafY
MARKPRKAGRLEDADLAGENRYAPARRLREVLAYLNSSGGATVYEIADRFGVSVRTAIRYIRALEAEGQPLSEDVLDRRKVWGLSAGGRSVSINLSTSQMVALFLSRRVFDFLAGTGFKEDLDEVFARLGTSLRRKDAVAGRDLDRKIFDINEAPHVYAERIEDVGDILTALLQEERLLVRHGSVSQGRHEFLL